MWSSWLISISIRFTLIRAHLSQTNRQGDKGGCSSWVSLTTYTPLLFFCPLRRWANVNKCQWKARTLWKARCPQVVVGAWAPFQAENNFNPPELTDEKTLMQILCSVVSPGVAVKNRIQPKTTAQPQCFHCVLPLRGDSGLEAELQANYDITVIITVLYSIFSFLYLVIQQFT